MQSSKEIARREKKAFLSDQFKETEENNRMGKTRDLFKKIRDTKGTLHAKMGTIKDRSVRDLTKAEDIKKRSQEYTEELYKKDLHDPGNHNGEKVTGRKARGLQMEEIACKCQTFLSLLIRRRKQSSDIFSFSIQI